jgi:hypothetical protein
MTQNDGTVGVPSKAIIKSVDSEWSPSTRGVAQGHLPHPLRDSEEADLYLQ